MRTTLHGPMIAALLVTGAAALVLCGAGCHHSAPPPPLPAGIAPVDSSKPPPDMQRLYQNGQAGRPAGGTANH